MVDGFNRVKYLHVFNNTNEKFSEPFIDFINSNFNEEEHIFYHIGEDKRTNKIKRENAYFITKLKYFYLFIDLYRAEKIFLHSLDSPYLILILMQPWLLKKCCWVVWGGDLYYFKYRKKGFKSNLYETLRKVFIKNVKMIATWTKGDYDLAKLWYHAKGRHFYFLYSNPVNVSKIDKLKKVQTNNNTINIQIGNSADPTNNHEEVLQLLKKFKNKNIRIYVPLSYGNKEHANKVIQLGKDIYGHNFIPLTTFVNSFEYGKYLATIDVAIFAHDRQQAGMNIVTLLYLSKKIYIKDNITTWEHLKNHLGVDIYNYYDIEHMSFEEFILPVENPEKNASLILQEYSTEKIKKLWDAMFNYAP